MMETLKQEVALLFCLLNEENFHFYILFIVAKNVQNNPAYPGFFNKKKTGLYFFLAGGKKKQQRKNVSTLGFSQLTSI